MRIEGTCDPAFLAVADTFERNFSDFGEVGASVALSVGGETVVDLWGGIKDTRKEEPWEKDTIAVVFSCTKAATALCAQILVDRGELELDAFVTDYWPEFGQNGKDQATVLMMLNHSVGVPALRDPIKPGGYYDWEYMVERLAAEAPFWEPGTSSGYHMITFGWTVGELVRRVSGISLGAFFESEVTDPLGADFWIGLPDSEHHRVGPIISYKPQPGADQTEFERRAVADPNSLQFLSLFNSGGHRFNHPEAWRAEIGGAGGVANARALMMMYTPLANGGGNLLSADRIDAMRAPSVESVKDATLLFPNRFGQGFMLSTDNRHLDQPCISAVMGEGAFGHSGMGGSIGFADPERALAFGYTMNRMGPGILLNERGQGLVDAAYASLAG